MSIFSGGLNFYAFADGNSISFVDPFELGAVEACILETERPLFEWRFLFPRRIVKKMAREMGIEPMTFGLEDRCSIH